MKLVPLVLILFLTTNTLLATTAEIARPRHERQHFILLNDLSQISGQAQCDSMRDYPSVSTCLMKLDQPKLQACHVYWYQILCVWGICIGDGTVNDRCEGEGYGGGGGSAF